MPFHAGDPIGSVFADIVGMPAWGVRPGYGSFLTLEFGEPHLEIREPMNSKARSPRVRRALARRQVTVHGSWHLWIYCCGWQVSDAGKPVAHHESSKRAIARAASALDGQVLVSASIDAVRRHVDLHFDEGGRLQTEPYDADSELWLLSTPSGDWLTYRADGCFSWGSGTQRPDEVRWQPLPRA